MIELLLKFNTIDELNDVVARLNGVESVGQVASPEPAKTSKAKKNKETAAENTEGAAPKPAAPAAIAPDLDTLKAQISKWSQGQGGDANAQSARIKEFVRGFGVAKISDMTDEQRLAASKKIASAPAAAEEDPMA